LSLCHTLLPPIFILFPYTTLFRSYNGLLCLFLSCTAIIFTAFTVSPVSSRTSFSVFDRTDSSTSHQPPGRDQVPLFSWTSRILRSEEHTSELQSRFDLVCRLLLEK